MKAYEMRFADGRKPIQFTRYNGAIEYFEELYPNCVVGHDGDLSDSGDRTLCWADEVSSENDDGAKAIASIYEFDGNE